MFLLRSACGRRNWTSLISGQLGIPTANIPPEGLSTYPDLPSGVYYGHVGLQFPASASVEVFSSVLSIGYNPFYKNTVRSVEIHVLHAFEHDFYGSSINLLVLGYIRPEYDYVSLDSLIEDIKVDCDVAKNSLDRPAYQKFRDDERLQDFAWRRAIDVTEEEAKVLRKDGNHL